MLPRVFPFSLFRESIDLMRDQWLIKCYPDVLGPYFEYLQHKHRTLLEERQRLLQAEAQGRVQDLHLEQLEILRGEAEGRLAKIQCISEYRDSKLY